jgi:putative membrane protein
MPSVKTNEGTGIDARLYPWAVRLAVRIVLAVVVNAIALLIAAAVLDGVRIDATGFVIAVAIFSLASLILRPVVAWIVLRWARPLLGVIALVTTFVLLLVTDLLSDGLEIEGALDWVLATVIVWLATMIYDLFSVRIQRMALAGLGRPAT